MNDKSFTSLSVCVPFMSHCVRSVVRDAGKMLNGKAESGYHCPCLSLKGKEFNVILAGGFCRLRALPCIRIFLTVTIMKAPWTLSAAHCTAPETHVESFLLYFVKVACTLVFRQ